MQTELSQSKLLSSMVLHYEGLVNYVGRFFGGSNFAADVVHDLCIHLIENPPTAEIEAPLSYLRKASFNRALDRYKQEKLRSDFAANHYVENQFHHNDGASYLELVQKIERIKKIIEELPRKQRQVFLLHQFHKIPQHEIAAKMKISANMVSRHFTKAISNITSALSQH